VLLGHKISYRSIKIVVKASYVNEIVKHTVV